MELYGISGAKGHGKDTFAKLILNHKPFTILHFADDLKIMAANIFNIPLESFLNPSLKEVLFDNPLNLDEFVPLMASSTNLPIRTAGLKAKNPRELMQLFGTEYVRRIQDDYWINRTLSKIQTEPTLIPDTRFLKEANGIKALNGKIIEILRIDATDSGDAHSSETERSLIIPDLVVGVKTGDLSLPQKVAELIANGQFNSTQVFDYRYIKSALESEKDIIEPNILRYYQSITYRTSL